MKLSFAVISSLIAVVSASTIPSTTASTMQSILENMAKTANTFEKINSLVNGFPQNGVKGAELIHDNEVKMHAFFESITDSINSLSKPVSPANAQKIIDAYASFIPTAIHSVNQIAAKEADFVALSAAPTMKEDLIDSSAVCKNLNQALDSITPSTMLNSLQTMVSPIETARANAIAAFS